MSAEQQTDETHVRSDQTRVEQLAGFSWRAMIVAVVATVIASYWIDQAEVIQLFTQITESVPPIPAVAFLVLLVLLAPLLRRVSRWVTLTRREIVTVGDEQILSVRGRRVCDIRGEFLPLVEMDEVFSWSGDVPTVERGAVLVLQAGTRAVAVCVSSLLGTQDLVVKSLDENFMAIRGLGGASILGDGEVCLLLDVAAVVEMITRSRPVAEKHA